MNGLRLEEKKFSFNIVKQDKLFNFVKKNREMEFKYKSKSLRVEMTKGVNFKLTAIFECGDLEHIYSESLEVDFHDVIEYKELNDAEAEMRLVSELVESYEDDYLPCPECEGTGEVEVMSQCNVYPWGDCCGGCTEMAKCEECEGSQELLIELTF